MCLLGDSLQNPFLLFLFTVFASTTSSTGSNAVAPGRLNIVTIMLGGNPAYEYGVAAPTYDVAFEDADAAYPGLFNDTRRTTIFRLGRSKTCEDEVQLLYSGLGEIFRTLSRLTGPTVVQTPGKFTESFINRFINYPHARQDIRKSSLTPQ